MLIQKGNPASVSIDCVAIVPDVDTSDSVKSRELSGAQKSSAPANPQKCVNAAVSEKTIQLTLPGEVKSLAGPTSAIKFNVYWKSGNRAWRQS